MQGKNRESYLGKKRDELMAENSILKDSITGYEISCSNLRTKLDYKVKECEDFEEALQSKNKAIWEYLEIIKKKDDEISKLKEDKKRISFNLQEVLSERKEDEIDDPLSNSLINQFKVITQKNQKLEEEKRILSNQFEKEKERREDLRNAEQQLIWKQQKIKELKEQNQKWEILVKDKDKAENTLLAKIEDYKQSMEELSIGYDQKCREVESLKAQRDKLKVNFDALAESVEKEHKAKEDLNKKISEIEEKPLNYVEQLRNCIVWNENGLRKIDENGIVTTAISVKGTFEEQEDYKSITDVIASIPKICKEKPSHVYSVRSDNTWGFALYRDAADAFKNRDKRNATEKMHYGGQEIFWRVELEEIR